MRAKPLELVAASGRALHFLVSLGEPCLCLLSMRVSICVELFMLPQHKFASPVVMFTKSKFKYMSCGGKAINMHAEMMWSLDVHVRGGGGAGGKGCGRYTRWHVAPGFRASPGCGTGRPCQPQSLKPGSALPAAGPHLSTPLAVGRVRAPAAPE